MHVSRSRCREHHGLMAKHILATGVKAWLDRVAGAFRIGGRVDVGPWCLVHLGPRVLMRNGPAVQRGRPIPVMTKIAHRSKSSEVQL